MKDNYRLNQYLSSIFYLVLFLLVIGLSTLYYLSQKNITDNFKNRIYKNSLHIREQFRLLVDKIQYDFRQKEQENIEKLNFAVDYINKNEDFSIDKLQKLLNENVTLGKYEVFIINKKYTIEKTSFKADLGLDFSKFKVVKELFDSIFEKKIDIDISAPKVDSSTMSLKRYLVKLSTDGNKIIQIAFALDSFALIKQKHKSLKYLADEINLSFATKNTLQHIDLYNQKLKKKTMEDSWKETLVFLNQLSNTFPEHKKEIMKLVSINVNEKSLVFNEELTKILKNKDNLLVKVDNSEKYSIVYSITNGLFNKNDETKLIVKTKFNNESLKEEINKTLYTSILVFVVLFLILFFVYRFILSNVTTKLLNIIQEINNNQISNEKDIIVQEIKTLQDDYNQLHNKLNNEVQKNQLLLSQNKQFISDMVHQIRTPLSVIMANTNLIELTQKDKNTKEFIDSINSSINMLTNSYEDLSFIVANDNIKYTPKMLSISELLKSRCRFFSSIANSRKRDIIDKIESNINFFINEIELERMIDNNISNCIKYSKPNTLIEISLTKNKDSIKLEFISIGEEIKDRDKLFDRYYRENNSQRGSGIGLNIVKNVCDKYNIKINITSKDSKNIFTYTF
ncbi:MAG: hypothetical protein CL624_02885 [Arcobacter sp.]|nr:hypothetical protein [Arcobacter sp.]